MLDHATLAPATNGGHVVSIALKLRNYGEFSEETDNWLAELTRSSIRSLPPRVDVLRQGGPSGPMCILLQGWAIRYKTVEDGRRQILGLILPGDLFDLNSFAAEYMDHSIASLTNIEIATLEDDFMDVVRANHPDLEKNLWCDLHVAAATQREWTVSMGQRNARERLAHLMCEIVVRLKNTGMSDGKSCPFPLTQSELSEALGMTQVYVNRTLQDLRRDGLIKLEGRKLTILDLRELKRQALFDSGYLRICEDCDSEDQPVES